MRGKFGHVFKITEVRAEQNELNVIQQANTISDKIWFQGDFFPSNVS